MAINPSSLLMQLNPSINSLAPLAGGGQTAQQREQLKLMREQFEETKRRNLEDERLRRESEAGERQRAQLMLQKEKEQQAAIAEAKLREQQELAYGDFYKRADERDFSGMQTAAQRLSAHGGLAESMGTDDQGRPSWRVAPNAAEYQRQRAQLAQQAAPGQLVRQSDTVAPGGYAPGPEMDESALASLNRLNALGYGQANAGILDAGALIDQSREQSRPVLEALQQSYPESYQGSVGSSNRAAELLGISPLATVKEAQGLRGHVDPAVRGELDAERDLAKEERERAPKPLTRQDIAQLAAGGAKQAKEMYDNRGIGDTFGRSAAAENMIRVLEDDDPTNDQSIAFELPNMLGSKGAQSNKDLAVALGMDTMSTIDQISQRLHGIIRGGFIELRKESLVGIIRNKMEQDDELIYEYLDALHEAEQQAADPDIKRGLREYADQNVSKEYRDAWAAGREGSEEPVSLGGERQTVSGADAPKSKLADDADFMETFEAEALDAGLDPDDILPLIHAESGGDPSIQNKQGSSARGLIQFLDSTAQKYGFKDSKEFAALSAKEQAPYIIKYLKDSGVTADHDQGDIYVAIAAPAALNKGDDYEVYFKDAEDPVDRDRYAKNTTWDLDGDGVITRGEIYRWGLGERKEGGETQTASRASKQEEEAPAHPDTDPTSDEPDALTSEHSEDYGKKPVQYGEDFGPPAAAPSARNPVRGENPLALLPFDTQPGAPKKKGRDDDLLRD